VSSVPSQTLTPLGKGDRSQKPPRHESWTPVLFHPSLPSPGPWVSSATRASSQHDPCSCYNWVGVGWGGVGWGGEGGKREGEAIPANPVIDNSSR
jgi:hypothetical protein